RVLMGLLEKDPARRLDVHTARAMLRELLAGPLTSTAAAVNSVTDPYSVVPVQRPVPAPPAAEPEQPKPSGQIGGRAMLGPDESLTDRLAALRRGERPAQAALPAGPAAAMEDTSADALSGPLHTPTGAMPAPGGAAPAGRTYGGPEATPRAGDATQQLRTNAAGLVGFSGPTEATQRVGGGASVFGAPPEATQRISAGTPVFGAPPEATQQLGGTYGGGQWSVPGTGQPWTSPATAPRVGDAGGGLGGRVRATGGRLVGTVRGWPRKVQLAAAGGLAVLLVGAVVLFTGGDDPAPTVPQAAPTSAAPVGVPEMKEHSGKGVRVMVPQGWERKSAGNWVDYVDPEDDGRKVRILVENFSTTSIRWAEVAEEGLKTRSKSCVKPYAQLAMNEMEWVGKQAAEFEYTCGEGEAKRHGVWRGVVHEGKAYSFYLTVTDAKFDESKPIFDEMVKSFQLTDAG
ncbi:PsbP-related protein, partial [Micromonospora sp. NPDC004336]